MDVIVSSSESLTPCNSIPFPTRSTDSMRRTQIGLGVGSAQGSIYLRDEHVQDRLFGIIVDALSALFKMNCLDELASLIVEQYEALLTDHYYNPTTSRIRALVPDVKAFFTLLPFAEAFAIYNKKYRITRRQFIPPTFHEIRHIMNIAQVMAVKDKLALVTLDGDETLYPDRRNFEDSNTAHYLTTLLQSGVNVAVVTAAGYGYQTEKYESRLRGLLDYWKHKKILPSVMSRFFLFGGESNYLFRCNGDYHLSAVPESEWRAHLSTQMKAFFHQAESPNSNEPEASEILRLLNIAGNEFDLVCEDLALRSMVIRKERAVGLVPGGIEGRKKNPTGSGTATLKPEILEEAFYRVHSAIRSAEYNVYTSCDSDPPLAVPFCAFNGGHDVWVDVGNKAEGVRVLQSFLNIGPDQCLHIGDQFTVSGNDIAARDVSPTLWICNPEETKAVLRSLLRQMQHEFLHPDDCEMDGVDSEIEEEDRKRRGIPIEIKGVQIDIQPES